MGNDAWILSYRDECFDQIGLKPSEKIHLFNGSLDCQFRKYQIFDGKYKAFRTEHNDKPFRGERREFKGAKKPFRKEDGERKPFFRKEDGERKPFRKDGERKPFRPRRNEE
jgi:putative N6-adenine-specific DNA methylase